MRDEYNSKEDYKQVNAKELDLGLKTFKEGYVIKKLK